MANKIKGKNMKWSKVRVLKTRRIRVMREAKKLFKVADKCYDDMNKLIQEIKDEQKNDI